MTSRAPCSFQGHRAGLTATVLSSRPPSWVEATVLKLQVAGWFAYWLFLCVLRRRDCSAAQQWQWRRWPGLAVHRPLAHLPPAQTGEKTGKATVYVLLDRRFTHLHLCLCVCACVWSPGCQAAVYVASQVAPVVLQADEFSFQVQLATGRSRGPLPGVCTQNSR